MPENPDTSSPNLHTLPPEIQVKIASELPDPKDFVRTFESIKNLRLVSRSLSELPEVSSEKKFKKVADQLAKITKTLNRIPIRGASFDRETLRLQAATVEAAFIPLKAIEARGEVVEKVLGYRFYKSEDALSNLISNMEYMEPEDRSDVTHRIFAHQMKYGGAEDLLTLLIKKAEYLAPKDRSKLAELSCPSSDETHEGALAETRREALELWRDKMHLLNHNYQAIILGCIYQDARKNKTGNSLACFAEHLDRLSPLNRSSLTEMIIALRASRLGKWVALSHLAKHLPSLSDIDGRTVVNHVIENYATSANQVVDLNADQLWHSKAEFCKIEAIHHLATHRKSLEKQERKSVDTLIEETINRSGEQRFAARAQLISHLSETDRNGFVKAALGQADENDQQAGVAYALTARMNKLYCGEREIYFSQMIEDKPEWDDVLKDLVGYNIRNNLEHFTSDQITKLVRRQIDIIPSEDRSYAALAFENMTRNVKYMRANDVDSIATAAREFVRRCSQEELAANDEEGASIRSCSGHVVRCLAGWASEAISNPRSAQWKDLAGGAGTTDRDLTDNVDDELEREHSSSDGMDERHSAEQSLEGHGSNPAFSDDGRGGIRVSQLHRLNRSSSAPHLVAGASDAGSHNEVRPRGTWTPQQGTSATSACISDSTSQRAKHGRDESQIGLGSDEEPPSKRRQPKKRDDHERDRSSANGL